MSPIVSDSDGDSDADVPGLNEVSDVDATSDIDVIVFVDVVVSREPKEGSSGSRKAAGAIWGPVWRAEFRISAGSPAHAFPGGWLLGCDAGPGAAFWLYVWL